MRRNRSSVTAMGIAVARGVESEKPADERIFYDPYARRLIPDWLYSVVGFFIKTGYAEMRGPGIIGYLAARERYIDDVLQNYLNDGLQQLVILGAGFDSRAYRFDLAGRVNTFEVDNPVTQAEKIFRLKKVFGSLPGHVRFIPIDFITQNLPERLLSSGYDSGLKTLFIWQGVTMYLSLEAVDATLAFVVNHATSGSGIVFDYLYQAALDGTQEQVEVRNMRRYHFMTGERLTFGIPEGSVEAFLLSRGFREVVDVNAARLREKYFSGKNEKRKIVGGYGIVVGMV